MAFLTTDQAAALVGSTVRMATLVELQFASATSRLWNGVGRLTAAGQTWHGAGELASINGLQQAREPVSAKVTMRLSGVDPALLASALASVADVQGRPAYVWLQLFDDEWQPLGARIPIFWGTMQRLNVRREAASEFDGGSRVVELEVENGFAARGRPSAGRWTDADQQTRYPGDRFFRWVATQRRQTIVWPDY